MKQIQDAAKLAVTATMQRLIKDDVKTLLNTVVNESISMVTENLRFKMVPIDNTNFRVEAYWLDVNKEHTTNYEKAIEALKTIGKNTGPDCFAVEVLKSLGELP